MGSNSPIIILKKKINVQPMITTIREKVDINKDPQLRKTITTFYYKKAKKWMENYKDFKHTKKNLKIIKSNKGYKIIYNLLRKFVKKNKVNWYELRKPYYEVVKDYLKFELANIN